MGLLADYAGRHGRIKTLTWLATEPGGGLPGGRFFYQRAEETPAAAAQDDAATRRLWADSETLLAKLGF